MIGAAQKVFAMSGYHHASTDSIVKEAGISKGLLFHYFETKLGLYAFVYDYSVRFFQISCTTSISKQEKDFFLLAEQTERAWADAMRQFPYIRLFLSGAEMEDVPDAASAILESRGKLEDICREPEERASVDRFRPGADPQRIRMMIRYTAEGIVRRQLYEGTFTPDTYREEITGYIGMLRQMTYKD